MTKNKFIVDEIIHKFDTLENTYIKLGSISGNINEKNDDILEEECTIIIPNSKAKKFCNQFNEAMNFEFQQEKKAINEIDNIGPKIWFGKGLTFKK